MPSDSEVNGLLFNMRCLEKAMFFPVVPTAYRRPRAGGRSNIIPSDP